MNYLDDGTPVTIGNYLAALAVGDNAKANLIYQLLTDFGENKQEVARIARLRKILGVPDRC